MPAHHVDAIATECGGGFGAKYGLVEPLAAALARRVRRPVRSILDRTQDFMVSHPAPGAIIRLEVGARTDGLLTALEAEMIFHTGCAPAGTVRLPALLLSGSYRCPNLDVVGYEVLTHKASAGSYRAPGAPQAYFALVSHMSRLAGALGLDPIEIRLMNAVRVGDLVPDGRTWPRIGPCRARRRSALRSRQRWACASARSGCHRRPCSTACSKAELTVWRTRVGLLCRTGAIRWPSTSSGRPRTGTG